MNALLWALRATAFVLLLPATHAWAQPHFVEYFYMADGMPSAQRDAQTRCSREVAAVLTQTRAFQARNSAELETTVTACLEQSSNPSQMSMCELSTASQTVDYILVPDVVAVGDAFLFDLTVVSPMSAATIWSDSQLVEGTQPILVARDACRTLAQAFVSFRQSDSPEPTSASAPPAPRASAPVAAPAPAPAPAPTPGPPAAPAAAATTGTLALTVYPTGAQVRVDGQARQPLRPGMFELEEREGTVVVEVASPGQVSQTHRVAVRAGVRTPMTIALQPSQPPAPVRTASPTVRSAPPSAPRSARGLATLSTGSALLVAGLGLDLATRLGPIRTYNNLDDSEFERAESLASTIRSRTLPHALLYSGGISLVTTGIIQRTRRPSPGRVAVTPAIGPGTAAVMVGGSWPRAR